MGRPSKNIEVLGDDTGVESTETIENVTAEVVSDDAGVLAANEIKRLKAELAEKNSQLKVISEGSQKKVRDTVKKVIPGGDSVSGTITVYNMR